LLLEFHDAASVVQRGPSEQISERPA
jgi:hypothetical protein